VSIDFQALRAANAHRQSEWSGHEHADIEFRALEVADEAGEVMGAVKKLVRARRGIQGSTMTLEDVADEIGDTVIALDLLACDLGLELSEPRPARIFENTPVLTLALGIDGAVGNLMQAVLGHLDRLRNEWSGDDEPCGYIHSRMQTVLRLLIALAEALGIDPNRAVAAKFNKTSAKYGLSTTMQVAA
jgi:NTP pyrophosphatase (non-canonical NTP hydrolase)